MLVGREVETARIDHLLDEARQGRSGTLLLVGEPGIGKSALCAYARERAAGMTVLSVRGVESEAELAYAALADLLQPVVQLIDEIAPPQAASLKAALALGPPAAGDRFTTCAATLSLLAAAAERSPLLAVVDDAQWLDRSSAQALLFGARRLDAEGVLLLVALRELEGTPFAGSGLPQLTLGGLDAGAAAAILGDAVAPEVARRLAAASGGNPLALLEAPSLLTPAQLAGAEPIDEPLPTSEALERAFLRRVELLADETRRALLIAAASGSSDFEEITAAVEGAGLTAEALDAAEQAGLTAVAGNRFDFRHPLLRAAVYHGAPAASRRAAHEAAAAASRSDRRAWHLAAASPAPDASVVAELEAAATAARVRGGHAEAAAALERAARLAAEPEEQARLLRDAADEARRSGQTARALALLDEALAAATEPELVTRIEHLRGVIEMWSGAARSAQQRLAAEAARVEATDPARAAWLLADAGWARFMIGDVAGARAAGERAAALAEQVGGFSEILASALHGMALLLTGEKRRAQSLLRAHEALLDDPDFMRRTYTVVWPAGQAFIWLEEHDKARTVFTRVTETARARSVPSLLPYTLTGLAELDFRSGAWARAYANAAEAVALARETEQPTALAFALATLARVEAGQGREDDCRAHVTEARDLAEPGVGAASVFAVAALGLLELGLGRSDEALPPLEHVASEARIHELAEPTVFESAPDLVEAYARAGRRDEAARTLAGLEVQAEASASSWALAAAARCRGLLAADDAFEADFARALELEEAIGSPFERGRTQLCLGERLRRARRRKDARESLRAALEQFERLGAAPWAERARAELRASGETLRRRDAEAPEELTPQELQVALLVAKGATNREAGAALFLSPKTVEAHLGRVYRKLGLRSRTELAVRLAHEAGSGPVPVSAKLVSG